MEHAVIPKTRLRVDEAATELGCSHTHIYHLIEAGCLEPTDIRVPGMSKPALRITRESLNEFIERRKV